MAELLLIARLGGRRIAFPAGEVESVVEIENVTPVPRAAAHVAGLAALRSRVLTVIDGLAALEIGSWPGTLPAEAVVIPSAGHAYAVLVEEVEDVVEASVPPVPVPSPLGPGWARIAAGLVEADGDLLLLIDPHALIAGAAAQAA